MILYDYCCGVCNNTIEQTLKMDEARDTRILWCIVCDDVRTFLKSIGNSGGFRLNGSGWFKDGYSKPSKPS